LAALDRRDAHVRDRIGTDLLEDRVEKPLDRVDGEVADRDPQTGEAIVLTPLPVVGVVVPERLQHRQPPRHMTTVPTERFCAL
jgi:hypothetical protein